ncbi:MAG: hypothetical protein ISS34_06895 [Candidatus Omnitrophica bacterium]|nr:hypothetical protein [Candidatus Omnitrophota bacterium]
MFILSVVGIISLAFGISLLLVPDFVRECSRKMDKVLVVLDEKISDYRVSIGIVSLAVGIAALFLVYYLKAKYGV